ncbi:MAG: hypothetical protein LUO89_01985 [Methanothrix sp.]|nr:hypothetical protein [Methanothrix sp.]
MEQQMQPKSRKLFGRRSQHKLWPGRSGGTESVFLVIKKVRKGKDEERSAHAIAISSIAMA